MKKIILIVPYFGKLPNYFQLWLNSCEYNKNINWLLITDDKKKYNYPKNVLVTYLSFEKFKDKIQKKFDFVISLESSYKLCDYRPAYGYILEDEIKEYSYWGYCDIDLIFGDLESFLKKIHLEDYDKLFQNGHLSIYKNSYQNNRVFFDASFKFNYKDVFKNKISFGFDESETLEREYIKKDKKIFKSLNYSFLDIDCRYNDLYALGLNSYGWLDKFSWENGKVFRYIKKDNYILKEEFIYIHLQKRRMKYSFDLLPPRSYFIENNEFKKLNKNFKWKKKTFNSYINEKFLSIIWEVKKVKNSLEYKKYILKKYLSVKING